MTYYADDRKFTDFVHAQVAMPKIYEHLGWQPLSVEAKKMDFEDKNNGIDYFFKTTTGLVVGVQERFREAQYNAYNDFTLRYRRDFNRDVRQHPSEFFKIKADFMVYGIINSSKQAIYEQKDIDFLKFAVINLQVFFEMFVRGRIRAKLGKNKSYILDNQMIAPIKHNTDNSSSFVAFDIRQLQTLFGKEDILLLQKGFLEA